MDTVKTLMEQAEQFSILVADAIIKRTHPVEDDLSEREAKKAYGGRWLNKMKRLGLAEGFGVGNKIVYSRHKLDCLRAAERQAVQMIFHRKPRKTA